MNASNLSGGASIVSASCDELRRLYEAHIHWNQLIADAGLSIQSQTEVSEVLQTTVNEMRRLLGGDRVLIYQLGSEGSGQVTHESVAAPQWSLLHRVIRDTCAEELRRAISALTESHNGTLLQALTASFGVATFPNHGTTPSTLLQVADAALYQAKANGRNQVIVAPMAVSE